jgi:hypothetical protein
VTFRQVEEIISFSLSNIRWGLAVLGVLIALVVAFGSSICVVTVYAGFLGFQARGTPDSALINEFANSNAAGITSIFVVVGTFLGGLYKIQLTLAHSPTIPGAHNNQSPAAASNS